MNTPKFIVCHECDFLQREITCPAGATARCFRCGAKLYRVVPNSLDRTLAYLSAAACLFVLANMFPLVSLNAQGNHTSSTLFGTVRALHETGMTSVAALTFVTTMLMPGLELAAMLYMLVPLAFGRVPLELNAVFRLVQSVKPWGMVEVFMLGMLVSLAKLTHFADVVPGVALWSFGLLMVLLPAAAAAFDPRALWLRVHQISEQA